MRRVEPAGQAFRIDLIDLLVSAALPLAIIDVQEARHHRVTASDRDSAIILAVVMQRDCGLA